MEDADFSGYATKAGLKCSDGRTIMPEAFQHMNGMQVPLVWQHGHKDPENVLGHAVLEARSDGVYAYGYFNNTPKGVLSKALVQHKDVTMMSIYANQLVERAKQVFHGSIREVSLVLAGANPGALIDFVRLVHGDGDEEVLDDEAVIYTGLSFAHAEESSDVSDEEQTLIHKTVREVYDTLSDEQKEMVHFLIGAALDESGDSDEGGSDDSVEQSATSEDSDEGDTAEVASDESSNDTNEGDLTHQEGTEPMTRNVFEQTGTVAHEGSEGGYTLTHSDLKEVMTQVQQGGSFKQAMQALAHQHGVTNVEELFPEAKNVDGRPEWITRNMEWVDSVLNAARKLPFTRIKSRSADLTHEEARAKGYIKGNMKKEQFFSVAHRKTEPDTIYKKQKLDRDDIIDVDFDIVAWMWEEMRFMLREEIARAVLLGDGRPVEDPENPGQPNPDKIDETKIRPIASDDHFYTHRVDIAPNVNGESFIEAVLRTRKHYKGAGSPTMFTTEDTVTDLLLLKDKMGRRLYPTEAELRTALRVNKIVPVEVMEGHVDEDGNALVAIFVNMSDYSIGTDNGGQIATFDDFDIDYNQYKYLIEGRMSGALTKHKTALAIWRTGGTQATPTAPGFDAETNTLTVPASTGVVYLVNDEETEAGDVVITEDVLVEAEAADGYFIAPGTTTSWAFDYTA